jgi:hypothetical protein
MFTFKVNFDGDDFRRKATEALKQDIEAKLRAAGVADRVKVTYSGESRGVPARMDISGSEEDVAKAKKALGIKES